MAADVLVVDDEPELREAVAGFLTRSGYAVRTAANAAEARAALQAQPADAVILDIVMPGEDGISLLRSLRGQPDLKIIMLTANAESIDRVVGLELGADDYIGKPFDLRELVARLRAVLRRRPGAAAPRHRAAPAAPPATTPAPRVRVGRAQFCRESNRLLSAEGYEIPAAAPDLAVLRALAEAPGRVLPPETLQALLARFGPVPEQAVEAALARLRKHVEKRPSRPQVLRSVRHAGRVDGYLFEPDAGD